MAFLIMATLFVSLVDLRLYLRLFQRPSLIFIYLYQKHILSTPFPSMVLILYYILGGEYTGISSTRKKVCLPTNAVVGFLQKMKSSFYSTRLESFQSSLVCRLLLIVLIPQEGSAFARESFRDPGVFIRDALQGSKMY